MRRRYSIEIRDFLFRFMHHLIISRTVSVLYGCRRARGRVAWQLIFYVMPFERFARLYCRRQGVFHISAFPPDSFTGFFDRG
ncbi:MAG: hypothetical protein LBJ47_05635 [Tannerella sp.]|nr:hypothetical protein [Tannerella sp.]